MMLGKMVGKITLALVATVAMGGGTIVAGSGTAFADTGLAVGVSTSCGYLNAQTCTGEGYPVATGLSTVTIEFTCGAASPGGAQATKVSCYILGANGATYPALTPITAQGAAAATGGVAVNVLPQAYRLCVRAGLVDLNGNDRAFAAAVCFNPII